jgi:hypothetical protein
MTVSQRTSRTRLVIAVSAVVALSGHVVIAQHRVEQPPSNAVAPGSRVLLDAHNAYPERGQWADRIDRAIATGVPIAIEQDLYWYKPRGSTEYVSVVAHDDDALDGAPTLDAYFFARIRPIIEQALRDNKREQWPLIVLNLDFKDNLPPHLDAVWALLGQYEAWLTTAERTASPNVPQRLRVGPLLVLCGSDSAQRRRFHDDVPVGAVLRAFGAAVPVPIPGLTKPQRVRRAARMSAAQHIPQAADNFARWVNFPWSVIEEGGQTKAGAWTARDASRLLSFTTRAHANAYWIRFYTLDGFAESENRGYSSGYNFGNVDAARVRWRAAIEAAVDFVATDQYEDFATARRATRSR